MNNFKRRKLVNMLASGVALTCVVLAVVPLIYILIEVVRIGAPAIDWEFLTSRTKGTGEPGEGIGNAILGTLLLVGYASAIGLPIGIFTGIYVSEFGNNRFGETVRFFNDILANFPSIVIGLLAYALVVDYMDVGFSLIAGAFALAIIMIPIVANTTEEALRMVPNSLREGALALGVPRRRAVMRIMLVNAKAGVVTGSLLAVARIAGETAPLILTAFYSNYWSASPFEPIASLPQTIFRNYNSPSEVLLQQAWGAALVLITIVLAINISVRLLMRSRTKKSKAVKKTWLTRLSLRA
ncbi:MAG: phosphate ABC transporter permease PstA [Thermoplasmata archaeon]|jgi:phosphate transport system permease protein|nr:phosphate ABC transporter permease PstA [Thermoplasmata archaeon]